MTVAALEEETCRIDVWLWRARFFKTRALAGRFVCDGRVRRLRDAGAWRLDKPSRTVRPGDGLVFALGGRVASIQVRALGERRGPAIEAQTLYVALAEETIESLQLERKAATRG